VDLVNSFNLSQIINEPTHFTGTAQTLLDLIITDSPAHVVNSGTMAVVGLSRHNVIYCKTTGSTNRQNYYRDFWDIRVADFEGLNNALADIPWDAIFDHNDINKTVENWFYILTETSKEYIPYRRTLIRAKDKPWITPDIKNLLNRRNTMFKRWKRNNSDTDHRKYLQARFEVKKSIVTAKLDYNTKMADKLSVQVISNKDYWKLAKYVCGSKKHDSIPPLVKDGTTHSDPVTKTNILADYFASQSKAPIITDGHVFDDLRTLNVPPISEYEVYSELSKLNTKKATGPD
jgi:hypothetical protein